MASGIYTIFKADVLKKTTNLDSGGDTIKVGLLDNSHAFTAGNDVWSDISANEISGTGYSAGGATLGSQSVAESGTTAVFDGADTQWTTASFTAYHAVLYSTTNSSHLICSFDFGGAQTVTVGTFTIQWNASGILTLS